MGEEEEGRRGEVGGREKVRGKARGEGKKGWWVM